MILHVLEAGPTSSRKANPNGHRTGSPTAGPSETGIGDSGGNAAEIAGATPGVRHGVTGNVSIDGGSRQIPEAPPVVLLHGLFGQARNFGQIQRALAQRWRVLALDLRNHGASPHGPDMRYATMAEDVLETLGTLGALPAALIGHSMGGKVAMRAALSRPAAVERLLVADIAPVVYRPHNQPIVDAMLNVPLHDGLTRAEADAALQAAVPDAAVRAFLLQNLRLGAPPAWRIGLNEIEAAMADIEGWDGPADPRGEAPTEGGPSGSAATAAAPTDRAPTDGAPTNGGLTGRGATEAAPTDERGTYAGRALFVAGEASDYIRREDRPAIRALFPAARFVTVKRAGHWLHADNPAGFLAVVEAFLSAPPI